MSSTSRISGGVLIIPSDLKVVKSSLNWLKVFLQIKGMQAHSRVQWIACRSQLWRIGDTSLNMNRWSSFGSPVIVYFPWKRRMGMRWNERPFCLHGPFFMVHLCGTDDSDSTEFNIYMHDICMTAYVLFPKQCVHTLGVLRMFDRRCSSACPANSLLFAVYIHSP